MMLKNNLQIYIINGISLGVTTFANIESGLKILLLIVTIGFTVSKWIGLGYGMAKKRTK